MAGPSPVDPEERSPRLLPFPWSPRASGVPARGLPGPWEVRSWKAGIGHRVGAALRGRAKAPLSVCLGVSINRGTPYAGPFGQG